MILTQRKHFVWLAGLIRKSVDEFPSATDRSVIRRVAENIADGIWTDNPSFDRVRFIRNIFSDNPPDSDLDPHSTVFGNIRAN